MVTFRAHTGAYIESSLYLSALPRGEDPFPAATAAVAEEEAKRERREQSEVGRILHPDRRTSAGIRDRGQMYSSSHREATRVERPRFISHCYLAQRCARFRADGEENM